MSILLSFFLISSTFAQVVTPPTPAPTQRMEEVLSSRISKAAEKLGRVTNMYSFDVEGLNRVAEFLDQLLLRYPVAEQGTVLLCISDGRYNEKFQITDIASGKTYGAATYKDSCSKSLALSKQTYPYLCESDGGYNEKFQIHNLATDEKIGTFASADSCFFSTQTTKRGFMCISDGSYNEKFSFYDLVKKRNIGQASSKENCSALLESL